jgi:hypothetical protein
VRRQLVDELVYPLSPGRLCADDRRPPALLRAQRQNAPDLSYHRVGQRVLGLVDHDHVGDLHHPRLQRLDRVAGAGLEHKHDRVRVVDDVHLRLAHADGLEEHIVLARGVHQQGRLESRLR